MSLERDRLFEGLSRVYRRDGAPVPALTFSYSGSGTLYVTVEEGAFVAAGDDGAPSLTVDTETAPLTLAELVTALNGVPGYDAALVDAADGSVLAGTLNEVPEHEWTESETFTRWTSSTWRLLDPIRRLVRAAVPRLDAAVAQLNLLLAAGFFADFWGRFTDTLRRVGENDGTYTVRQLHELIRPRANNQALAAALEDDTGVTVIEVRDLRRDVFVASGSPLRGRPLAGPRYNTATAEIHLGVVPSVALIEAAARHAAAGIRVFVRGELGLEVDEGGYTTDMTPLYAGTVRAMQIGVGQIGVDKIGSP